LEGATNNGALFLHVFDAKRIHGYNESIQAVTAEALQVTAREIINPKRITAVMVKSAYEMV
jgi:predicted Zn-dependent peptidase